MKKIAALAISILMLFSCLAELPDVSNLNNDELQELQALVNAELVKRQLPVFTRIGGGTYVAGKTIKPGTYILVNMKSDVDNDDEMYYSVRDESFRTIDYKYIRYDEDFYVIVVLLDGYDLYLKGSSFGIGLAYDTWWMMD